MFFDKMFMDHGFPCIGLASTATCPFWLKMATSITIYNRATIPLSCAQPNGDGRLRTKLLDADPHSE